MAPAAVAICLPERKVELRNAPADHRARHRAQNLMFVPGRLAVGDLDVFADFATDRDFLGHLLGFQHFGKGRFGRCEQSVAADGTGRGGYRRAQDDAGNQGPVHGAITLLSSRSRHTVGPNLGKLKTAVLERVLLHCSSRVP